MTVEKSLRNVFIDLVGCRGLAINGDIHEDWPLAVTFYFTTDNQVHRQHQNCRVLNPDL